MRTVNLYTLLVATASLLLLNSCTKKETVYIDDPGSCFTVYSEGLIGSDRHVPQNKGYVSRVTHFINCTKDSAGLTFEWDFGNGKYWKGRDAGNTYYERGNYTVVMSVFKNGSLVNKVSKQIRVVTGQRTALGFNGVEMSGIDVAPAKDGGHVVLCASTTGPYTEAPRGGYFLIKYDSLWIPKWWDFLELPASFTAITALQDGGFVLCGNPKGPAQKFSLTKVDAELNIVWSRTYDNTNRANVYVAETKEGDLITIGNKEIKSPTSSYTTDYANLLKTDKNGNVLWEKNFLGPLPISNSDNILVEDDGYVFAAHQENYTSSSADSATILKVNPANGNLIWQGSSVWGLNYNYYGHPFVIRSGDGYKVMSKGTNVVISFSSQGVFTNRNIYNLSNYSPYSMVPTPDGNIAMLASESNPSKVKVHKFASSGEVLWTYETSPWNNNKLSFINYPDAIKSRPDGRMVVLGTHMDSTAKYRIFVVELDKDGQEL